MGVRWGIDVVRYISNGLEDVRYLGGCGTTFCTGKSWGEETAMKYLFGVHLD